MYVYMANMLSARRTHIELQGLVSRRVPKIESILQEATVDEVLRAEKGWEFEGAMESMLDALGEMIGDGMFQAIQKEMLNSSPLRNLMLKLIEDRSRR